MQTPSFQRTLLLTTIKICSVSTSMMLLTQCGTSGREVAKTSDGEFQADHGPFDSKGNYVEAWADNPPKRIYKKPFMASKSSKSKPKSKPTPEPTTSKTISKSTTTYKPTTKSTYKPTPKPTTKPKTTAKSKPTVKTKTTYKPKPKPTPKPTPKPKKFVPKTKPPVMHTVTKGDTVYGLARKYGADASVIIKVNNLKNGAIHVGQRLVIPRK